MSLVDSTIIAATVSAIVAFVILVISNFLIHPRRWKRNLKVKTLERRLEVYGALLTILDSMAEKAKRQAKEEEKYEPHTMENPYDYYRLSKIFERENYLLSDKLSQLWLQFIQRDTYFAVYRPIKEGHGLLDANFTDMHALVRKEYAELKQQYKKITGIQL